MGTLCARTCEVVSLVILASDRGAMEVVTEDVMVAPALPDMTLRRLVLEEEEEMMTSAAAAAGDAG